MAHGGVAVDARLRVENKVADVDEPASGPVKKGCCQQADGHAEDQAREPGKEIDSRWPHIIPSEFGR